MLDYKHYNTSIVTRHLYIGDLELSMFSSLINDQIFNIPNSLLGIFNRIFRTCNLFSNMQGRIFNTL
jgi:hypothetical protein